MSAGASSHLAAAAATFACLPEPRRTVRLRNQFGQQSIDVGEARYLLVPTQKLSDPHSEFPKDLDHYRCYEVVQVNCVPPLPVVQLGDQFGKRDVRVLRRVYLAVPTVKEVFVEH